MYSRHRVLSACAMAIWIVCAGVRGAGEGPLPPCTVVRCTSPAVRRRRLRDLADLTPDAKNANRGTARGRAALAESLRHYGGGRAILADRHGRIIAGNKTLAEATKLGMPIRAIETRGDEIVVVQRTDLDLDTPKGRALAVADNRVAELDLEWDPAMLQAYVADGVSLDGFWTPAELETLLGEGLTPGATPDDVAIVPAPTTLKRGACFQLGRHRLLCGDATDAADVDRLLAGAEPFLMVTDPPYGVTYDPAWRHLVAPQQRTAVGRVLNDDRVDWAAAFARFPGDVAYVWHAGLHAGTVATSLRRVAFAIRGQIVWAKQHFAMGRGDYHWQHEPCWYAVRQGRRSRWRGDRTQSTLWSVPNLNPMGGTRTAENAVTGHSTQKPVRLFERAFLNHTEPGEAVYDPFVGSGTAIIAAEKTGRVCYALDLDPVYVQAAVARWEAYSGQPATRVDAPARRRRGRQ